MPNPDDKPSMFLSARSNIFKNAGELRANPTPAEARLWESLRNKQLGFKFRRQHPCGPFILDFYCHALKIAIEVDGGYHEDPEQRQRDEERSKLLEAAGIRMFRVTNKEVMEDLAEVVRRIREFLEK